MERRSRVDDTGLAFHGSQRQIQLYVNRHAAKLSQSIVEANPNAGLEPEKIEWVSPLHNQCYREYWDKAFLDAVGLGSLRLRLADFWPKRGPHGMLSRKSMERSREQS